MVAPSTASADATNPVLEQLQAHALWTFVHLKATRFTSQVALEVVRQLAPRSDEDPKHLAKRLRAELSRHGVALKHSAALDAAARLLGHATWHAANRGDPKGSLKLTQLTHSGEELFAHWRQLTPRLCDCCKAWLQQNGTKVFEVQFGPSGVTICVPETSKSGTNDTTTSVPLLVINPVGDAADWLQEAPAALESLRRYLEEPGSAVLDGIAVLELCNRYSKEVLKRLPALPQPVRPTDACNSELVLLREDNELQPGSGWEIARGDEMTCWSQLELAMKDHQGTEIILDDGAWRIGTGRYVWQLSTIHPKDYIPGHVISNVGVKDSEKLLRRYRIAKRVFSGKVKHHEVTKRLQYLSGPADTYRVDLHKLLLELNKAGFTWETFCEAAETQQDMVSELSLGFIMTVAERLKLEDPNVLFARPSRSELARVDDDTLLRTLLPRVDHVRYKLTREVSEDTRRSVREAIEEFSTSMRLQKLQAAGHLTNPDDPLPYLVYASDAEELRQKLEAENLVAYAGVVPYLFSTEAFIEALPGMWSFGFGNSLYLDIDFVEGRAK